MASNYLRKLSETDYDQLKRRLWATQSGRCFICDEPIDLAVHEVQVDHVIPLSLGGPDGPQNFALAHASCNESKQDADLRVARVLARFSKLRDVCAQENRGPNLDDVLQVHDGGKFDLQMECDPCAKVVRYSLGQVGDNAVYTERLHTDELSGFRYFFASLPIEYLHHDDRINPRSIGQNIAKLVKEFHLKRPQLHVSLAWVAQPNGHGERVRVFDGQHKAAAQILLGTRTLPVRVFVNPDLDVLLTTNTNAGTTLHQVAFDKSVQRHLGSALYYDRVVRYQQERGLADDDLNFSERDLVEYYRGESREMKRYILDSVRDRITHSPDNKLKEYVDFGGRGKEKPVSYSSIERTFYSFFVYPDLLDTPVGEGMETGDNRREIEVEQILKLMNIVAEEMLVAKYDQEIGTFKIENRIQKGEDIPDQHLMAYRIVKEEILYNWLRYVRQIALQSFILNYGPFREERLFQYRFPDQLWERIRLFVRNLSKLPVWVNRGLSLTVFGGKQNYDYWQTIFEGGKSPQGLQVLAKPLDLMGMIQG